MIFRINPYHGHAPQHAYHHAGHYADAHGDANGDDEAETGAGWGLMLGSLSLGCSDQLGEVDQCRNFVWRELCCVFVGLFRTCSVSRLFGHGAQQVRVGDT